MQSRNDFALALDRYKTSTLGLPPDLPVELDDQLIRQFQLVAREATSVQDSIIALRDRVGQLPNEAAIDSIRPILADIFAVLEPARTPAQRHAGRPGSDGRGGTGTRTIDGR